MNYKIGIGINKTSIGMAIVKTVRNDVKKKIIIVEKKYLSKGD